MELKDHECVSAIAGTAGGTLYYLFGVMDIAFLFLSIPLYAKARQNSFSVHEFIQFYNKESFSGAGHLE